MADFQGLTSKHFSPYEPSRWSSMVHNLARMQAKDTLVSLAQIATEPLEESLGRLVRGASDEIPNITNGKKVESQWVYWYRSKEDRETLSSFLGKTVLDSASLFTTAAQDKHIVLALVLAEKELSLGLHIAPSAEVDRRNLRAHINDEYKAEKLVEVLKNLPPHLQMGALGELAPVEQFASEAGLQDLVPLLDSDARFFMGYRLNSDEACKEGSDLLEWVTLGLRQLLPLYQAIAWSKTNDCIGQGRAVKKEKAEKIKKASNFKAGDKVRITTGLLSGQIGIIENVDAKAMAKVAVGKMSVKVHGQDLVPLS